MSHDPLCGLAAPCDDEIAEHGYCSMQHGAFCIHCHQWCICERLAQARADERGKFVETERFLTKEGEASIPKHMVEFIRADERKNAVARINDAHRQRRIRSVGRAIAAVRGES